MGDLWKNFILVFLIILIIHYIIKNHLLQREIIAGLTTKREETVPVKSQAPTIMPSAEKSIAMKGLMKHQSLDQTYKDIDLDMIETMDQQVKTKLESQAKNIEAPVQSNDMIGTKLDNKKKAVTCMQDLYDYVFNDEIPETQNYGSSYGQTITNQSLDTDMRSSCDMSDVFTNKKPVCNIDSEIKSIFKENEKPKVNMTNLEGNSQFTVVNKYKGETIMNGGEFFNIKGYDSLEPGYSLL